MAIDKSLYQTPKGIEEAAAGDGAEPIEIEIVDPEEVNIKAGDMEIHIEPGENEDDFHANLAEEMDESALQSLAGDLAGDVSNDIASRKDWEDAYREGLTLLGLKYEERTEPWSGACGVFHPMITEAVVRFQSETIMETFPAKGPVKTQIVGKQTREKEEAAQRVEEDMNYQLTERMTEFRPEHERMLWSLPATGSAFKKVYFDPSLERQVSLFVPAEDIILPYGATELTTCQRVTHRMRKTKNDILKLQVAGFYRDVEIGEPTKFKDEITQKKDEETGFSANYDDRFELYECHVDLDLPGFEDEEDGEKTGIALPYVVTFIRGTNEILAIRRNWREDDDLKLKRQHFVHYQYIPGFGAYGFGLFHLIGGFAKSATSIMRQLVDAGTLANLPGGLKSRGLRIKGDDTPIAPGEFRDVDVGSGAIRDNILPLPYKEPSQVLYTLLGTIVEEGRRFAATADMKVSDMSAQAPVGTTLAILERMLKVMSAVQARVHYSFKQELRLLSTIIRDYTDDTYNFEPNEGRATAKKSDYSHVDIIPVSDPNAATMSQRVVQYQAVIQLAQSAPQIYDLPALHRQMLDVLGIKDADKLVPTDDDQKPRDPVSENMAILKGKPVKAFLYQDHEAHIAAHMAAVQDPLIQQMVGQSPMASQIQAAMSAHIAEHLGFAYRNKIEAALGVDLPMPDEDMPPELEVQISRMIAQAAPQVLQQSQAQVAQQQAQQQAQETAADPLVQLQQQELQLKAQEVEIKKAKTLADIEIDKAKLQLEAARIQSEERKAGAQMGMKAQEAKQKMEMEQHAEGVRIGVDIAKNKEQFNKRR
ncbi:hypothetical protein EBZ39_07055 [bacterium]|nr:hypothetical protein [bacterium]